MSDLKFPIEYVSPPIQRLEEVPIFAEMGLSGPFTPGPIYRIKFPEPITVQAGERLVYDLQYDPETDSMSVSNVRVEKE